MSIITVGSFRRVVLSSVDVMTSNIEIEVVLDFWVKKLNIYKSQYCIITVMYNHKKLRDRLIRLLPM